MDEAEQCGTILSCNSRREEIIEDAYSVMYRTGRSVMEMPRGGGGEAKKHEKYKAIGVN